MVAYCSGDRKERRISGIEQQLWDKKTVVRQFSEVEPTELHDQLDMGLREREGKKDEGLRPC